MWSWWKDTNPENWCKLGSLVSKSEFLPQYKYVMLLLPLLLSLLWRQSLIARQQELICHLFYFSSWYFPYSWNKWKYQWYIIYLNQTLDICTHKQFSKAEYILYVQICYSPRLAERVIICHVRFINTKAFLRRKNMNAASSKSTINKNIFIVWLNCFFSHYVMSSTPKRKSKKSRPRR